MENRKRKENKLTKHICVVCGKEFEARQGDAKFCSYECGKKYHDQRALEKKTKDLLENGVENVDYIIDRWNGLPTVRLYGRWFRKMHPGRTMEEYKAEFPDAPITIPKDKNATSRNSGQYMKKQEYREKYSKMMSGENNPNHHTKATEQKRKENSPFSKEFYKRKNMTESDRAAFLSEVAENRSYTTRIDYYISKGMSSEEAETARAERQRTCTLKRFIKTYGEEEGTRRYNERNQKWAKTMKIKYENGEYDKFPKNLRNNVFSNEETNFVKSISEKLNLTNNQYYAVTSTKGQLSLTANTKKCRRYNYDFCINDKIIEFNGDY